MHIGSEEPVVPVVPSVEPLETAESESAEWKNENCPFSNLYAIFLPLHTHMKQKEAIRISPTNHLAKNVGVQAMH